MNETGGCAGIERKEGSGCNKECSLIINRLLVKKDG